MESAIRIAALRQRTDRCRAAVDSFVRIREELIAMHAASTFGAARDRVEAMLSLNQGTMDAIKRSLAIAEAELHRAEDANR